MLKESSAVTVRITHTTIITLPVLELYTKKMLYTHVHANVLVCRKKYSTYIHALVHVSTIVYILYVHMNIHIIYISMYVHKNYSRHRLYTTRYSETSLIRHSMGPENDVGLRGCWIMECLLPYLCMVTVPHIMVGLERIIEVSD